MTSTHSSATVDSRGQALPLGGPLFFGGLPVDVSRSTYFLIPHMGWTLGFTALPWIALWLRSFRWMLLLNSSISFILIICFYWLDESPRWQITKRQFSKAEKTIKKAMQMNGKSFENLDEKMEQLKRCIVEVS